MDLSSFPTASLKVSSQTVDCTSAIIPTLLAPGLHDCRHHFCNTSESCSVCMVWELSPLCSLSGSCLAYRTLPCVSEIKHWVPPSKVTGIKYISAMLFDQVSITAYSIYQTYNMNLHFTSQTYYMLCTVCSHSKVKKKVNRQNFKDRVISI